MRKTSPSRRGSRDRDGPRGLSLHQRWQENRVVKLLTRGGRSKQSARLIPSVRRAVLCSIATISLSVSLAPQASGSSAAHPEIRIPTQQERSSLRNCGRVVLSNPYNKIPVFMRVRGVKCKRAETIVESSLFGQGARPIGGWICPITSSVIGRCDKGRRVIVYWSER